MTAAFVCRACGSTQGRLVLDLGLQPLANNVLRPEDLNKPEPRFPLRLFVCPDCWLLQIADLVPPVELFSEYLYFSSFSDGMLQHARQATERYCREFSLDRSRFVVEIASNDGYFLQYFQQAGVPCLGIEPAHNVARVAREKGIETLEEFFSEALARKLAGEGRQADLLLGNNVFAHAPDINDFVAGLRVLLKLQGRVILEFPHAVELIEKGEFDTIYHEHVFYFSLTALQPLFERHGLPIFHVEKVPIHGGSLRLFAGHAGAHSVQPSVQVFLTDETNRNMASHDYYAGLARKAHETKVQLTHLLAELKRQGKRIAAYGAAAKGSTLLNYCDLDPGVIEFVADRSPHKQGRLTPGLHLPIVPAERLLEAMPDYTLVLTWNFAGEVLEQQRAYRAKGGKFILPVPEVRIV